MNITSRRLIVALAVAVVSAVAPGVAQHDIYRPRNAGGGVPIVFVKTPYNFKFWDVRNGVPSDMTAALTAVKRGYAYVVQNERGHFFSEGNYDILGPPTTDGYHALDWLSTHVKRPTATPDR